MITQRTQTRVTPLLLLAGLSLGSSAADAQERIYVQAVDSRSGGLITDLRREEVVVRQDGVPLSIVDVRPANLPLKLVVVVNTGVGTVHVLDLVRDGLRELFTALPPHQDMSLLSLSPAHEWLVQESYDRAEVDDAIDRLEAGGRTPAPYLDGLVEAAEWVVGDPLSRPVIVALSTSDPDASQSIETGYDRLMQLATQQRITMHTVVMTKINPSSLRRPQLSLADAVGRDLRTLTDGYHESVVLGSNIANPMRAIGGRILARNRELASQYLVRYERPADTSESERRARTVRVSLTRLGATVTATTDGKLPPP